MSSGQFPIAVGSHPIPVPSSIASPLLSSNLLRLFLSRAPIRAAPLQEITWYTIETQAEVAIYQFPGWTRRRRSRFRFSSPLAPSSSFTAWTGLNDAWKSIASISRTLSLVTQSRSANCEIFISLRTFLFSTRRLRQPLRARCLADFICCRNRNPSYRVINYVARRPRWNKFVDRLATTLITTTRPWLVRISRIPIKTIDVTTF